MCSSTGWYTKKCNYMLLTHWDAQAVNQHLYTQTALNSSYPLYAGLSISTRKDKQQVVDKQMQAQYTQFIKRLTASSPGI